MGNTNVKPHPKPRSKKPLRWKAADRPSTPGKPSLIGENGSIPDVVHIGWTKPEKDGSSTVTSYLVEHRRVGTTHWLKASSQPVPTNEIQVKDLEPGWRYQFRVRAQNAVGLSDYSEASEPYTLTLQRTAIAAPKFTQELKDTVVLEDDKVNFEIHFLGQPPPNICWFKDGFEIFSGNRTRVYTAADKSVLTILQATAADEGEIKCTATNKAGHASTKSKLTIEAPPSIKLPRSYQDQDGIIFEIGETIKLNVTVNGRPLPLIFWSHDGETIQNDDRYEIEYNDKIATLKIENALRSDRGEYQVKAVNKLGQDQASFLVTITDKPTPPGKARVLLTSGKSVTLGWSTPKDDGGSKIGNYIIEYYRMGWDVWLKAATTRQHSTMLGDLIEGSTYKFRVKAESPYGVSEPSEESEIVVIPEIKRNLVSNVEHMNDSDSRIPLSQRRRANSTPRVSFILNEGTPVRPERKKTGKTPEASPRMRRKELNPLSKNNLGSEPFLNRKFPPASVAQTNTTYRNSSQGSWNNSQVSNFQDTSFKRTPITTIIKVEKHKSPSPEIIITDADLESQKRIQEKSPSRSPNLNSPSRSTTFTQDSSFKNMKPTDESYSKALNNLEVSQSRNSEIFRKSPSRSPSGSPNSPEKSPLRGLYYPENPKSRSPSAVDKSPPIYQEKSPSRSPNHFQMPPIEKSPPGSPSRTSSSPTDNIHERSPVNPEYSKKPSPSSPTRNLVKNLDKKEYSTPNSTQLTENYNPQSQSNADRMKPSLTRQQFSGSSEFMLVLCPEGEQGTHFRKFGISFEENSIPPPLSLSAPELGFEPPEPLSLRRSASSTELLTYRLMERLHEEVMGENEEVREVNMDPHQSAIPTIQVNSEPAREENPVLSRRSSWSKRRYSLKNAKDMGGDFGAKLRKFEETDAMRREVSEYRRISESEEIGDKDVKSLDDDDWMRDYEESVSEEDSQTSSQDERPFSKMNSQNDFENDDEEMYNPRSRMMSAVKTDDNQPFEILTVRKNPPSSNIIPKPILKKTSPVGNEARTINSKTNKQSLVFEAETKSNDKRNQIPKRNRSSSLSEAQEDEMDVDQVKMSSKPIKRRSFSLIPNQANLIKDALKPKETKIVTESRNEPKKKNVSALASFTSIAGAGFILPNEMKEKKETEEEAKVVVDFYGDIVKNFGGKSKPTAEFSRSMASKYDTYEERKISDIKPNADSLALHPPSPRKPEFSSVDPWYQHSQEKVVSNAKPSPIPSNISRPKQDEGMPNQPSAVHKTTSPHDLHSYKFPSTPQEQAKLKEEFNRLVNMNKVDIPEPKSREGVDESFSQMRTDLSESRTLQKPTTYRDVEMERSHIRPLSDLEKTRRERRRSGRSGTRSSSIIGRRKQTPMSRDASTSPVRFSDDWDSQCSSRNSLEHDYYNRGSLTSSRASSLSRRSLSPPKPRVRGITTQTSFRIEPVSSQDVQKREDLVKKAEDRMSFVFGYLTDAAMVGVAAWLFIFQSEYLAVPFIVIPIYRQLDQKIQNVKEGMKNLKEGVKKRLPRWIRKRFEGNS